MNKLLFAIICSTLCLHGRAQDNRIFEGTIYNDEHKVYIAMDLYNSLTVPGQEIFGEVAGYLGNDGDNRRWLFVSAEQTTPQSATLSIINDYGSEDLTATLSYDESEKTYTLKQIHGSPLKIVVNRKWVKLPKVLRFRKRHQP